MSLPRTYPIMVQRRELGRRSAFSLAGLSVALTYVVSLLTPLGSSPTFWLRGSHYVAYQALYLPLLITGLVPLLRRHDTTRGTRFAFVIYGAMAGYMAGLIAYVVHPLFLEEAVHEFAQSLKLTTREAWIALFWFPVRLQSWLFGVLAVVMLLLIRCRYRKGRSL